MALIIRRNGKIGMADSERLAAIREQIRAEFGRGRESLDIYLAQLRGRIREYERRYETSSASMLKDLQEGRIRETGDISLWAWTWQTLNRLEKETPMAGTR